VSYAYVGVTTVDLTPTLAEHFGLPVRYGAAIASVGDGTPAEKAGLRAGVDATYDGLDYPKGGDVIVAIDGRPVRNKEDVVRVVTDTLRPGQVTTMTVVRGGKRETVSVKLGTRERNG
jgi:serine protease Do